MKSLLFLSALLCLVCSTAFTQIDQSIPTPPDLQGKEIEILTKVKLADGRIEIRYIKNGKAYIRKLKPAKGGEIEEVQEEAILPDIPKGVAPGRESKVLLKATGTGRTTGHIANLSVTNNNDVPITVVPQTFFIPSDGHYQSYVGHIPEGITVPPKGTVNVPVNGVCTDVHTPPVPAGTSMPPIDDWIPVGDPYDIPTPPHGGVVPADDEISVVLIPADPELPFTPDAIPDITGSPGYTPVRPGPGDNIIITWPGSDIPVNGKFDPRKDPESFARVIVDAVERIEEAAEVIHTSGDFPTPFTNDPSREIESFIQQQVWIFSAIVTGSKYEKEDFAENVYDQFTGNTGVAVTTLPKERKDDLESGIDDFWNAFQAVGVEAKVISAKSPGLDLTDPAMSDLVQAQRADPPPACGCDSLKFVVARDFGGLDSDPSKQKATKFSASKSSPHRVFIELDDADFKTETKISVSGLTVYCSNCGETPCHPYAREKEGGDDEMVESRKGNVLISDVTVTGAKEAIDDRSTDGQGVSVKVTPDKGTTNYIITFKVGATCMASGCAEKPCFKYISIEVKQKAKKK